MNYLKPVTWESFGSFLNDFFATLYKDSGDILIILGCVLLFIFLLGLMMYFDD